MTPNANASLARWRDHIERTPDGCLVWQGRIDPNGYGRIGGRWVHRAVYELEIGPIPERHEIDHLCCNPPCVNPGHLDPVTRAEHVARTFRRLGADRKHLSAAYLRTMGLTYKEIAQALDYTSKNGAADAVKSAIRKGLVSADALPVATRLTEEDREDIRSLRQIGVSVREIARWYKIDESQVSRVSRGLSGGHA